MMRAVRLYGPLAKEFGKVHHLDVSNTAEAVRALETNFPGFAMRLRDLGDQGYGYRISCGKKRGQIKVVEDEINSPVSGDIYISPVLTGSKKQGMFGIIAGAVLIIASFYFPPLLGLAAKTTAAISAGMLNAGIAMALTGVVQMLTPVPSMKAGREASNTPSFMFNGVVNTQAQGHPVPFGYGEMIVGSAVISAGMSSVEIPVNGSGSGTGGTEMGFPMLRATFGGNVYLDFTGEVINGVRAVAWFSGAGVPLQFTRTDNVSNFAGGTSDWNKHTKLSDFRLVDPQGATRRVRMCMKRHGAAGRTSAIVLSTLEERVRDDGLVSNFKFTAPNAVLDQSGGLDAIVGGSKNAPAYYEKSLALSLTESGAANERNDAINRGEQEGVFKSQTGTPVVFVPKLYCWMTPAVRDYLATDDGKRISVVATQVRSYDEVSGQYESLVTTTGEIRIRKQ